MDLKGFDIRFLESGMTMMTGTATVTFSNGKESFEQSYDVMVTYSEGIAFSIGCLRTSTLYTKELDINATKEDILSSFEGIFITAGASFSPPQLSSGALGISPTGGYTFTVDYRTKEYDPTGWQGITGGIGAGAGLSRLNFSLSLSAAAYKLPNKKWRSEYFYNMVFLDEE